MRADEFFARIASQSRIARLHPLVASYLKGYLSNEKAVRFGDRHVLNTHFPPYPGRAFDRFVESMEHYGRPGRRLYSVTWAVTNRCDYQCWHCYNAGRSQVDVPVARMIEIARELQDLGAVMVTLTGGEPLQRADLEDIAGAFDDRTCLILGTTGQGLSPDRARALRDRGVFAAGISLDSQDESLHDQLRGHPGAFRTALAALRDAEAAGLYPYVVSVATREFLEQDRFYRFLAFARDAGAREVHLLEPAPAGRLAGRPEVCLNDAERKKIIEYQHEVSRRDDLPILSSFAYLESAAGFGCGAGLTHLYIDGSGQVCPCNLVPLSFGDASREPLSAALGRMERHFRMPRTGCIGHTLRDVIPEGARPCPPDVSDAVCAAHLAEKHDIPAFFHILQEAQKSGGVGAREMAGVYDRIHGSYDAFWLVHAGAPVTELVGRLGLRGDEKIFEAGCGTGFATALLAARLGHGGRITAVDISTGMLGEARRRLGGGKSVSWVHGDALDVLRAGGPFDLVFSSWVLGYIPLAPFFTAAAAALRPGGRLAFLVHRDGSPSEALEIFRELVTENPMVLRMAVAFDFPSDLDHARSELARAGFDVEAAYEGAVSFRYKTAEDAFEHLLKSGAGTTHYEAVDPAERGRMAGQFLTRLAARHPDGTGIPVIHDFIACVAIRT